MPRSLLCIEFRSGDLLKDKFFIDHSIVRESKEVHNSGLKKYVLVHRNNIHLLYNKFEWGMFNTNAGHHRRFMVVGYNYRIKPSKKRRYLMLKIGYFYRIIMKIPDLSKICPKKRFFVIIGTNRIIFDSFVNYIRNLRNLYPYKKKGFVYRNEFVKLKKGKKTRFR